MTTGSLAVLDEPARFRSDAVDRELLAAAWGAVDGPPAVAPIRAYGGIDQRLTVEQRSVALFDDVVARSPDGALPPVLFIGSPTGSGWVNASALTAVEGWTRGACASVAMQYGAARSQASVSAVPLAAASITAVVREAGRRVTSRAERLRTSAKTSARADQGRATIVIWAESLGAWALLHALADDPALLDFGDADVHVAWVGVPGPVFADAALCRILRAHTPATAMVASGDQLDAVALPGGRSDVVLVHADDPVAHIPGPSLAWRPQRHAVPTAPDGTRIYRRGWLPVVTALRARRTLDLVTRPPSPSVLRGHHDYRYAAANVLRVCLGLPADHLPIVQRLVAQRAASVLDLAA